MAGRFSLKPADSYGLATAADAPPDRSERGEVRT
jgi:hypothetical protein